MSATITKAETDAESLASSTDITLAIQDAWTLRDLLVEDVVHLMERHFDGAELGGVVAEIDPLLMMRPPCGT